MKLWGIWYKETKDWFRGDHNSIMAFQLKKDAKFALGVYSQFDKYLQKMCEIRPLN